MDARGVTPVVPCSPGTVQRLTGEWTPSVHALHGPGERLMGFVDWDFAGDITLVTRKAGEKAVPGQWSACASRPSARTAHRHLPGG
jgi:hypothetical protein